MFRSESLSQFSIGWNSFCIGFFQIQGKTYAEVLFHWFVYVLHDIFQLVTLICVTLRKCMGVDKRKADFFFIYLSTKIQYSGKSNGKHYPNERTMRYVTTKALRNAHIIQFPDILTITNWFDLMLWKLNIDLNRLFKMFSIQCIQSPYMEYQTNIEFNICPTNLSQHWMCSLNTWRLWVDITHVYAVNILNIVPCNITPVVFLRHTTRRQCGTNTTEQIYRKYLTWYWNRTPASVSARANCVPCKYGDVKSASPCMRKNDDDGIWRARCVASASTYPL